MDNNLIEYMRHLQGRGWTVQPGGTYFIATKRKDIGVWALVGVIGLFFAVIPGLLILLIAYGARGTESRMVSANDALVWVNQRRQEVDGAKARTLLYTAETARLRDGTFADKVQYVWRTQSAMVFIGVLVVGVLLAALLT